METIDGYIERITFQNAETGFTVAQLQQPRHSSLTTVVGVMPAVCVGETVQCKGFWKQHLTHGRQFCVEQCQIQAPADVVSIEKYLGSGLIKGIGPVFAAKVVKKFGVETLNIIDTKPERLKEIKGLGPKKRESIIKSWQDQKSIREVMIFLQTYDVSPTYAQKIFKIYGVETIQKVEANPYQLARDITGIGFKTADAIAEKMGIGKETPQRVEAGIEHLLSTLSDEGHVCHPVSLFIGHAEAFLAVSKELISSSLTSLKDGGRIEIQLLQGLVVEEQFVWKRSLYLAEIGIAREMKRLLSNVSNLRKIDLEVALNWVQTTLRIELADAQKDAVSAVLEDKVHLITGGPGTGKSTITKAILRISEKLTRKIILAAPTGRAAKRMSEITHKSASTIHSLLEFDFSLGRFKRNRENPLDCDLLIIDESSMIDTTLMYSLLRAVPDHARLILVGDINQLPSVGPGNVLKDMISSNRLPVSILNKIFRQAAGSRIITNAHSINKGVFPDIHNHANSDFFFMEELEPEDLLNTIVSLVSERLPKKYGFNILQEIQVLAPMRRGVIGTENLNIVLQQKLNPQQFSIQIGGQKFQEGDKVMQIRNNYQREVFNGDIGIIKQIDMTEKQVTVEMDGKIVLYDFSDLDELVLSYAVSVHKYQGSECPCIVMPIHTTHYKLLTRNLLYTGVTRGKRLVVLVGTKKALWIAVNNDEVKQRYSGLKAAIEQLV